MESSTKSLLIGQQLLGGNDVVLHLGPKCFHVKASDALRLGRLHDEPKKKEP